MVSVNIAVACLLVMLSAGNGVEGLLFNHTFSEEGLNLKEFNSGESFYLWTTSSVKVA